jgi:hypothetical protein
MGPVISGFDRDTPEMIRFLFATGAFSISTSHIHPQFAEYL